MHSTAIYHDLVQLELKMQGTLHGTDEMSHVVVGMESNEVGTQQPSQQVTTLGQHPKQLIGGEGNMMKITYLQRCLPITQHPRQQHQLVILHPYHAIVINMFEHLLAEQSVHVLISLPKTSTVLGELVEIVAQGPDSTVTVALIIIIVLGRTQEHRVVIEFLQLLLDFLFISLPFQTNTRPSYPMLFIGCLQ